MTAFFRENGLKAGDTITLIHHEDGEDAIWYKRSHKSDFTVVSKEDGTTRKRLTLGSNWKVIEC